VMSQHPRQFAQTTHHTTITWGPRGKNDPESTGRTDFLAPHPPYFDRTNTPGSPRSTTHVHGIISYGRHRGPDENLRPCASQQPITPSQVRTWQNCTVLASTALGKNPGVNLPAHDLPVLRPLSNKTLFCYSAARMP
jgi:hypothetical protein